MNPTFYPPPCDGYFAIQTPPPYSPPESLLPKDLLEDFLLPEEPVDDNPRFSPTPSPILTFSSHSPPDEPPPQISSIAFACLRQYYDPHKGNIREYIFSSPAQGRDLPAMELHLIFDDGLAEENQRDGVELRIPLTNTRKKYIRSKDLRVSEGRKDFTLQSKDMKIIKQLWHAFANDYILANEARNEVENQFNRLSTAHNACSPKYRKF